jgi:hypothetical protein
VGSENEASEKDGDTGENSSCAALLCSAFGLSVAVWLDAELCGLLERDGDQTGVGGAPLLPLDDESLLCVSLISSSPGSPLSNPSMSGVLLGSGTFFLERSLLEAYISRTSPCGLSFLFELLGRVYSDPPTRFSFHGEDSGPDCGLTTISGKVSALISAGMTCSGASRMVSLSPFPYPCTMISQKFEDGLESIVVL